MKLFFFNGLWEEDQWVAYISVSSPYPLSQGFTVDFSVTPDGQSCVASHLYFKTWPSSAKYFAWAWNITHSKFTYQCLSQKCHLLFLICGQLLVGSTAPSKDISVEFSERKREAHKVQDESLCISVKYSGSNV